MTHIAPLVTVILASSLLSLAAAEASVLCAWTKVLPDGEVRYSFLKQDSPSPRLYHSAWSGERALLSCAWSDDASVIQSYFSLCQERAQEFSDHAVENFDLDSVFGSEEQCVPLASPGASPGGAEQEWHRGKRLVRSVGGPSAAENSQGQDERSEVRTHLRVKRGFIVPGTLWCGSGNKAPSYEDLGVFAETDSCCREHDQCKHTILSFHSDFGVFNSNIFTMSHCECDNKFRNCLREANDSISDVVGYTFFNLLKMHCFEFSHRLQCAERNWFGMCKESKMSLYAEVLPPTPYESANPTEASMNSTSTIINTTRPAELPESSTSSPELFSITAAASTVPTPSTVSPSASITPVTNVATSNVPTPSTVSSSASITPVTNVATSNVPTPSTVSPSASITPVTSVATSNVPTPSTVSPSASITPVTSVATSNVPTPSTVSPSASITPVTSVATSNIPTSATVSPSASITPVTSVTTFTVINTSVRSTVTERRNDLENALPTKNQTVTKLNTDITDMQLSCGIYKDLDECRDKILPQQKKYGLHNPEPRTLYHCNCTTRLFQMLVKQTHLTEVQALLLRHVSQFCFLPQDCTAGKICTAVLVRADRPQLDNRSGAEAEEWRHLQAVKLKVRRPNSRRAKRKDRAVRLHKLCLRMTRRKLMNKTGTRKQGQNAVRERKLIGQSIL